MYTKHYEGATFLNTRVNTDVRQHESKRWCDIAVIVLVEDTTPATPAAGRVSIFSDSADSNRLKMVDESGTVRLLETEWAAVPTTILPTSDNGLDLGSSAKAWRTLYIDTSIVLGAAASKIVPGATSFAIRNNADNANNLIITDAGAMTVRTSLTVTTSATITTDLTVDTSTLKVDSSNNRVGVGTASPSARLHIEESTQGNALIRLSNTGNSSGSRNWQITNQSDGRLDIASTNDAFGSINATALSLANSTGYVGMGTTSPAGKVHVYDTDGGMLFWRGGSINGTPQTIVTGVVSNVLIKGVVKSSAATQAEVDIYLVPNSSQNITLSGGATNFRISCSTGGDVTIDRTSGSDTLGAVFMVIYR